MSFTFVGVFFVGVLQKPAIHTYVANLAGFFVDSRVLATSLAGKDH